MEPLRNRASPKNPGSRIFCSRVHPLQGGVLHLQICAVEGVVEGEEVLLPVPVLGEVVHEEGVLVLAVLSVGFFV